MAVTKIIKIKKNTKACIKYIENAKKTTDGLLTTYSGCTKENAYLYFQLSLDSKNRHRDSDKEVKAYHIIQSFAKTDPITPQKAHELGLQFLEETFGNKYAFVCATHVDKGHIHNHFCLCAAEKGMTGRKLNDDLSLLHTIQRNSDRLCREYGLSVIEKKKGKSKSYKEWLADKESPAGSNKARLRKCIDTTIMESDSFDDFLSRIKDRGIVIDHGNSKTYGTVTKYKLPDEKRFHRGYSLGSFYTDDNIKKRIDRHIRFLESEEQKKQLRKANAALRRAAKQAAFDSLSAGEKRLDKAKLKISSMKDMSKTDVASDTLSLHRWANRQNAMRMQQIIDELRQIYGISYTDIRGTLNSLRAEKNRLQSEVSKKKDELVKLKEFIDTCVVYKRFKIYDINLEKSKNPEEYYQKNEDKLDAYHDALFHLNERGIDVDSITMQAIKTLQHRLLKEENELKNYEEQLRQNEREQKELFDYQKEIDLYLGLKHDEI